MIIPSSLGQVSHSPARAAWLSMTLICIAVCLLASQAQAATPAQDKNAKCLSCHSMKLKKSLANGEKLSLQVSGDSYAESVHGKFACASCHRNVTRSKHPAREVIENSRSYSLSQNDVCKGCHKAMFAQYEGSIHAALSAAGKSNAPLCTDCHTVHAIQSVDMLATLSGEPCKACHADVFTAYAESVHGAAREHGNSIRPGHVQAPICADCHNAHDISAVAAAELVQATCRSCHEDTSTAHAKWLPNSALHLDNVACAACHSPMAERRVDLELYDNVSAKPLLLADADPLAARIDAVDMAGDGLDPLELWQLVRQTSRDGKAVDVSLRGRLEVKTGGDAHRLAAKEMAIRDCEYCHQHGAEAFRTVTVSIGQADGRRTHYLAKTEVLDSASSVGSVGDFYAMGGTRITILDDLLILSVIFGLAVPLGHIGVRRYLKNSARKEQ